MSGKSFDFDTILDLCGHQHRRIVLATLAAEQRPLTLRDLMSSILEHNEHTSVSEASEEAVVSALSSLYHVHIPKLATVGVVEFDPERQRVEPTERFDQLQPTLSAILTADPALEEPLEL